MRLPENLLTQGSPLIRDLAKSCDYEVVFVIFPAILISYLKKTIVRHSCPGEKIMPNHVTNILYAEEQLLGALLNEEGEIDFGTILPMPDIDDPIFTAERHEYEQPDGEVLYGYGIRGYSPLDWARDNWGTKWNAYRQKVSLKEKCLSFETAWNSPLPVFSKLSELFPKERMVIAYADEDTGFNLGLYELEGGCISRFLPINEGSDEAVGLAEAIKKISERIGKRKLLCSTEESLYDNPIQLLEVNGVLGGDKENE